MPETPIDHDPLRGTGRTTGLMMQAIGKALLNPCTWIEFVDHYPKNSFYWPKMLEDLIRSSGLQHMKVTIQADGRVWLISLAPTMESPYSEPKHPICPPLPTDAQR